MAGQPNWQPISRLPLIGSMIDGMLQDAEEHYQTLLQASPKPHVLDDHTVGRVLEVFGRQKDDLWLFEGQLARWKRDKLSVGQRAEVDRLTEQVGRCRTVIGSILSLAEQLKRGTIEKVLAKSDLEREREISGGQGAMACSVHRSPGDQPRNPFPSSNWRPEHLGTDLPQRVRAPVRGDPPESPALRVVSWVSAAAVGRCALTLEISRTPSTNVLGTKWEP